MSGQANPEFKYWAFISYSHLDKRWGDWLHKSLETYRIPRHIIAASAEGAKTPKRMVPVFRDREELPTATNLGDAINRALEQSQYLIVICSPNSARSHWVNEEILAFKRMGRSNRILSLIVDGEPHADDKRELRLQECFPEALKFEYDDKTCELTETRAEPIAADARKGKDGRHDAKLKLVAGVLGVGFDDLKRRELQRKQRRLVAFSSSAFVLMVAMASLLVWALVAQGEAKRQESIANNRLREVEKAKSEAVRQGNEVKRKFATQLAVQSELIGRTHPQRSMLLAVEAVTATAPEAPVPRANQRIRDALSAIGGRGIVHFNDVARHVHFSPDGQWLLLGSKKAVCLWKTKELISDLTSTPITVTFNQESLVPQFSPDSRWIAIVSGSGVGKSSLRVWAL